MISNIVRWFRKRQRELDVKFLWPSLRDDELSQGNIDLARHAMYLHCLGERCWTAEMSDAEIWDTIRNLA